MLAIPNCISILEIIATNSQKNEELFTPKTPRFNEVKKALSINGYYTNDPVFTQNPDAILITQLIALTTLSMVGGVTMPVVKQLSIQESTIKINWGNRVTDTITLGQFDDHYTQFCRSIQQKIIGDNTAQRSLHKAFIKDCDRIIINYTDILTKIEASLTTLSKSKPDLKQLFSKEINPDLFFILLSSLPDNEINAFLLYIQSFLPDDLELKQSDGHTVNIGTLFQSPSSDIQYLITKIQIYLSLYYSEQLPIIRHITQSKSPFFLTKMLDNQVTFTTLTQNLSKLNELQVKSRLNLYKLYTLLIQKLDL